MATLQIKKKSDKIWEHIDSELGTFIVSKFYFTADFNEFQIVEQGQSKRRRYPVANIEVFDIGGSAETFVNITQLSLRLEELNYVGLSYETLIINGGADDTADHYLGTWNASTNTPTLTNGVGQIGDYYKVTTEGTQFGVLFKPNDIIAYNGSTWYKFVNNNQSSVLTTNTNITSANLTTQDVAGFVAYINALNPIITIPDYDIRTYTVTDTGQKFELLLRGRSFGFSQTAINSGDVLEIEKKSSIPMVFTGVYNSWNGSVLNTWRSWGRNTSNMLTGDANASMGTGASLTLANFIDFNFMSVSNKNSLNRITFTVREPASAAGQTFELLIAKADLTQNGNTSRGTELNYQILSQQTFTMSTISNSLNKDNFTIAPHQLSPATAIFIAYRQVTGVINTIQGVQLNLEFI